MEAAARDGAAGVQDVAAEGCEAHVVVGVSRDVDGGGEILDDHGVAEQVVDGGRAALAEAHEIECVTDNAGMLEALGSVPIAAAEAV